MLDGWGSCVAHVPQDLKDAALALMSWDGHIVESFFPCSGLSGQNERIRWRYDC